MTPPASARPARPAPTPLAGPPTAFPPRVRNEREISLVIAPELSPFPMLWVVG